MRAPVLASMLAICLVGSFSPAQTEHKSVESLRDKYDTVQVGVFDVRPGVDLPADFAQDLPNVVAKQLKESKKFQEVLLQVETSRKTPMLGISGTITDFDRGNRGKRYLAGNFGAGNARLFLTVRYADASDGRVLYEDKVVGTLSSGLFGGDQHQVLDEVARMLVSNTKLILLRPVPDPGIEKGAEATTAKGAEATDTQVIAISGRDLKEAERKLNELGGAGYRLADFRLTGTNKARVTMEKSVVAPQTYQYVVVHALSQGNVQKNLNKDGAEGYRLVLHTLAPLYGFTCIMERAATEKVQYEYHFRASQRESNAEKNVIEEQAEGFALVESNTLMGVHAVIMEKGN